METMYDEFNELIKGQLYKSKLSNLAILITGLSTKEKDSIGINYLNLCDGINGYIRNFSFVIQELMRISRENLTVNQAHTLANYEVKTEIEQKESKLEKKTEYHPKRITIVQCAKVIVFSDATPHIVLKEGSK